MGQRHLFSYPQIKADRAPNGRDHQNGQCENSDTPASPCVHESRRVGQHTVYAHRVGDVLDLPVSQRLIGAHELIFNLLVDTAGDEDITGIGDSFQACRNVDALAVNVIRFNNDVAEVDTDPIEDALLAWQ